MMHADDTERKERRANALVAGAMRAEKALAALGIMGRAAHVGALADVKAEAKASALSDVKA